MKKKCASLRTKPENTETDVTLIKKFGKSYKQNLSSLARFSSDVVHEKKPWLIQHYPLKYEIYIKHTWIVWKSLNSKRAAGIPCFV